MPEIVLTSADHRPAPIWSWVRSLLLAPSSSTVVHHRPGRVRDHRRPTPTAPCRATTSSDERRHHPVRRRRVRRQPRRRHGVRGHLPLRRRRGRQRRRRRGHAARPPAPPASSSRSTIRCPPPAAPTRRRLQSVQRLAPQEFRAQPAARGADRRLCGRGADAALGEARRRAVPLDRQLADHLHHARAGRQRADRDRRAHPADRPAQPLPHGRDRELRARSGLHLDRPDRRALRRSRTPSPRR